MRQAPRRFDAGPGLVVRALISLRNQCLAITRIFPVTVQAGCRRITIPGDRGPAAILRIRRRGAGYGSLWTVAHEPYPFRRISYNEIRVHAFARGVRSWALSPFQPLSSTRRTDGPFGNTVGTKPFREEDPYRNQLNMAAAITTTTDSSKWFGNHFGVRMGPASRSSA